MKNVAPHVEPNGSRIDGQESSQGYPVVLSFGSSVVSQALGATVAANSKRRTEDSKR